MINALITVYYPSESVISNVSAIAKQVDVLYICDNSPTENRKMFTSAELSNKIKYVFFGENLGLSGAFNRILKSKEYNFSDEDYIFFFDQDTFISGGHIENMINEYEALEKDGIDIGNIGPTFFNTSNNVVETPRLKKDITEDTWEVNGIITSSMLCKYKKLKEVGFWNERVFLDMADWELSWRLMAKKHKCLMTKKVVFRHSIGIGEKKVGPLHLRVGHTYREYYQMRECLYLLFKKYTPFIYRVRFLAMIFIRSPLHLIFLKDRKRRIRFIFKGLGDYFRKVTGPIDPEFLNRNM